MVCKKCGREIDDKATFCPYCGEKVEVLEEEQIVREEKQEETINPTIPTLGFGISIGLYVASYILIKLIDYVKEFADYFIFLLLIPLGVCGMVLTAFGRHSKTTRGIKVISWVGMAVLIVDYILLFALLVQSL
ncbi:MAG: zinc-ribbon domain-containing protein [Bacilli bacterium]|nr:zinc-ribbon domain-containing protein [Bacilli bacterium]